MSRKIFPLSAEAMGPLGFVLLIMQQPFVQLLHKATPANFGSHLLSELGGFGFMVLFMGPLLVWLTAKTQRLEFLRKGRDERIRIGYGRYFLSVWIVALGVDIVTFTAMTLTFSFPLFYGQALMVALVAATCATLFYLLYIGFLDRWVRSATIS